MSNEGNDVSALPPCFGVAWDEPAVPDCVGCKVRNKCKDKFATDTIYTTIQDNPGVTDQDLMKQFAVSAEAVAQAKAIMAAAMQDDSTEPEAPKPVKREQVKEVEETIEPKEGDKPIPAKKRRGRKPTNLKTCDNCGGTGWIGDELCPVCKGYGDHNFQDEKDTEEKPDTVTKGKGKKPNTKKVDAGDDSGKGMGGGDAQGEGPEQLGLPVQGQTVSNPVLDSTGDSGGETVPQTISKRKKAKGVKADSNSIGDKILQVEAAIAGLGRVTQFYIDEVSGDESVRIKLN